MLINSESQLRKYLPNAFATVEGEVSLYDKLEPYLMEAQTWMINSITGKECVTQLTEEADDNAAKAEACRVMTCDALMHAIPALDVVLTPNGFGVVSNQNIAPASKDRVQRLIDSIEMQRDDAIMHLMKYLRSNRLWLESQIFRIWSKTLLPDIAITTQLGIRDHQFSAYLSLMPRIIQIEAMLAAEFISPELLDHLHKYQFGIGFATMSPAEKAGRAYVLTHLRTEIVSQLGGAPLNRTFMNDLVQMIRSEPDLFPQWRDSATAQLFTPDVFENKKKANGYFF